MSEFGKLTLENSMGRFNLVHIVAVPRSNSTAFSRSLNESNSPSMFLNEPLNRRQTSLNDMAAHIMQLVDTLEATAYNEPPTVIIKNMASYVTTSQFARIQEISQCTLWVVRDPLIQMGSLLTRLANDIFVERGAEAITQSEINPYLDRIAATLHNSARSTNFSKTGWASIHNHYRRRTPDTSLTVDGGSFSETPAAVMQRTCTVASLSFTPRMINGWQNDYINASNGDDKVTTTSNAWSKHAATSTGVVRSSRQPLDADSLPVSLAAHIKKVALPAYREMTTGLGVNTPPLEQYVY